VASEGLRPVVVQVHPRHRPISSGCPYHVLSAARIVACAVVLRFVNYSSRPQNSYLFCSSGSSGGYGEMVTPAQIAHS
jgi:hypothetical protein